MPINKSTLSDYTGPDATFPEYQEDPYALDLEDPYFARQEILDELAPEIPTFRTLSLRDIRELPDPEWLVQRYLQADSFAVLYGAPGST